MAVGFEFAKHGILSAYSYGPLCADDPTNHKILMVLEYVEGGSLFAGTKISPKKRLSELQARKYFRDVLLVRR